MGYVSSLEGIFRGCTRWWFHFFTPVGKTYLLCSRIVFSIDWLKPPQNTLSPIIIVQWKMGRISNSSFLSSSGFHFHDYGRKSIICIKTQTFFGSGLLGKDVCVRAFFKVFWVLIGTLLMKHFKQKVGNTCFLTHERAGMRSNKHSRQETLGCHRLCLSLGWSFP